MFPLIVRRSFGAAATLLAATFVVFIITFTLPGDPARAIAGRRQVPESTLEAIRERYSLDDPLPSNTCRGSVGCSTATSANRSSCADR